MKSQKLVQRFSDSLKDGLHACYIVFLMLIYVFAPHMLHVSIVAPLKNALDWASRGQNCWADKPAAIVSAGGGFGGGRSQYHLRQVGVFLDLHFINKPELAVKAFEQPPKFDSDGNLIDAQIRERIKQVLLSLQAFTLRLQKKDWTSEVIHNLVNLHFWSMAPWILHITAYLMVFYFQSSNVSWKNRKL